MIWTAKVIKHRDKNRIAVQFEKDVRLIQRIKEFDSARWSAQKKVQHLPDTFENREHFNIIQYENSIPSLEGIEQIHKFK